MIIGIGIDIIEVDRLQKSIERFGDRFLNRVFTENEIQYCQKKLNRFEHFAVRFAAKEALLKAMGTGLREGIDWQQIEIINDNLGKPEIRCHGRCHEVLLGLEATKPLLSLSHTEHYGIATVILERDPGSSYFENARNQ